MKLEARKPLDNTVSDFLRAHANDIQSSQTGTEGIFITFQEGKTVDTTGIETILIEKGYTIQKK